MAKKLAFGKTPINTKRKPGRDLMHLPRESLKFRDRHIRYPMLGSPKLDGYRMLVFEGKCRTISQKEIKNPKVQEYFKELIDYVNAHNLFLDGDLYFENQEKYSFTDLQKIVHSKELEIPKDMELGFYIFDGMTIAQWERGCEPAYGARVRLVEEAVECLSLHAHTFAQEQIKVMNFKEAEELFENCVEDGYEGLILRHPMAPYKKGRATIGDGLGFKFKKWETKMGKVLKVLGEGVLSVLDEDNEEVKVRYNNAIREEQDIIGRTLEYKFEEGKEFNRIFMRFLEQDE
jgi:ATP-dependent DNA ligase